MTFLDQEDTGKKGKQEKSFATNFNQPFFVSYILASKLHYSYVSQIQ
jgi:hypothetical protein